jgi:hypothetical protein
MNNQARSVDSTKPAVKILPTEITMKAEVKTAANARKIADPVRKTPNLDDELPGVDTSVPLFFLL